MLLTFITINVYSQKLTKVFNVEILDNKFTEVTIAPNTYWEIKAFKAYSQDDVNKMGKNVMASASSLIIKNGDKLFITFMSGYLVAGTYSLKPFNSYSKGMANAGYANESFPTNGVLTIFEYSY